MNSKIIYTFPLVIFYYYVLFYPYYRQCYIEKVEFDIQKLFMQEIIIKLDKIEYVGPENVVFRPACETTNEFKTMAPGLTFLHEFLINTKSFLVPFQQ